MPAAVWALNRLLRVDFEPDISARAISAAGSPRRTELVRRLRIDAAHVITGHTHRGGPRRWRLRLAAGRAAATSTTPAAGSSPRPSTTPGRRRAPTGRERVTWLEDGGPPRRVPLLAERDREELGAIAHGGRFRLAALASSELG